MLSISNNQRAILVLIIRCIVITFKLVAELSIIALTNLIDLMVWVSNQLPSQATLQPQPVAVKPSLANNYQAYITLKNNGWLK